MLSKDYEKAVTEARALEKRLPDSRNVKLLLARSLAGFGKAEEALKILDNLPTGSDVEKLRTAIVNSGTQDAATLENELTKDPNNINLLANLCRVTRTVPAKALDYCKRAAQLEPDNIDHAIGYGAALVQAREFAQAIALLRKLSALKPDRRSIHANLATSLFAVDQFELAKKEFEWLIANDPGVPITYYFLAISHDNLGEYRQALENYQQFLKLADLKVNQLEVDKVNLRLPSLQRQIKEGKGKKP
jgi:predicted Zn-dependent protease